MDSRTFRDTVGRFATGITIVTTEVDGLVHGMTANAFSSVSLDPLLVLVCVDRKARCHGQLVATERFGINILASDQEDVSNTFARAKDPAADFGPVAFERGEHGTPLLSESLARFECRRWATYDGGDHDIFVGEVLGGEIQRTEGDPLIYYAGAYRQLEASDSDSSDSD